MFFIQEVAVEAYRLGVPTGHHRPKFHEKSGLRGLLKLRPRHPNEGLGLRMVKPKLGICPVEHLVQFVIPGVNPLPDHGSVSDRHTTEILRESRLGHVGLVMREV